MNTAQPPRMNYLDKQVVSLRLAYMGNYSIGFEKQLQRMLGMGFTVDDILPRCVDDTMRRWVRKSMEAGCAAE